MRTADTTVLARASKEVLSIVSSVLEDDDAEALEFDFDSITVLLTEFNSTQLSRENVQWVFWHLLEHVLMDVYGAAEELGEDEQDPLWENMDAYVQELEDSLKKRSVRVVCPRLEALLHEYWMEASESKDGSTPVPAGEEPEENEDEGEGEDLEPDGGAEPGRTSPDL